MQKSTNKDVRISYHANTTNKHMIMIRFYNDLDELFGSYVKLIPDGDRLYMQGYSTKVTNSLKVGANSTVCAVRGALDLKIYEGEYSELHYDKMSDQYYVDRSEARSITRLYGNFNTPKPNYKKHTSVNITPETVSVDPIVPVKVVHAPLTATKPSRSKTVLLKDVKPEDVYPTNKQNKEVPQLTPTATLIKALVGFQIYVEGMESAAKLVKELNEIIDTNGGTK